MHLSQISLALTRLSGQFSPASLFANGEQGAWYDPSDLTTLFTDSAGTTPVTAVEQFVGLMLDKRVPVAQTGYYSGAFDGSGDFLNLTGSASLGFGTGDFTFECWFYANTLHTGALIDFRPNGFNGAYLNCAVINTGQVGIYVNSVSQITSTATYTAGSWNHIAVTRAAGNTRLFLNGVQSGVTWADTTNYIVGASRPLIGANGLSTTIDNFNGRISNLRLVNGTALYTGTFTPPTAPLTAISGTSLLTCQNSTFIDNSGNNFTITANGDAKTGAANPFGNHAFQTNSTKRPELRARYNLLTYSEEFDNAAWSIQNISVTANSTTAPNGTTTADLLIPNTTNTSFHSLFVSLTWQNVPFTYSISAKAGGYQYLALPVLDGGAYRTSVFDLNAGTVTQTATGATTAISALGNGWYRCSITWTPVAGAGFLYLAAVNTAAYTFGTTSFAGDGTSGIYIWGADLRPASQATGLIGPTYQRVVDAATYDTVGYLPYLSFDGIDDSMSTGSIDFTATDKMTVWAGVRKLSDAAGDILVESSSNVNTNNGSFFVLAPASTAPDFGFASKGTVIRDAVGTGFAAPITNVLTGIGDISGDAATLRVNGTQAATNTNDQGIGNYGNYSLFIGARNNASLFFNGWLTSLIVRGAQSTQSQIEATESWVNGKTGAY
jgi:hypothetical protein